MQYALGGAGHMTSVSVHIKRPEQPSQPFNGWPQEAASRTGSAWLEFDKFRPLFGAAITGKMDEEIKGDYLAKLVVAKYMLEAYLAPSVPALEPALRNEFAELIADITFPKPSRGYDLAFALATAILSRTPESFSAHDRAEFASLLGAELFPSDAFGKQLLEQWILGTLDRRGETSLTRLLTQRDSTIKRFAGTNAWHIERQR